MMVVNNRAMTVMFEAEVACGKDSKIRGVAQKLRDQADAAELTMLLGGVP